MIPLTSVVLRRVFRQITAGAREYTFDLHNTVINRLISGACSNTNINIAGRHWGTNT